MDEGTVYRIRYTETAAADLEKKALYLRINLRSPQTARNWYTALRAEISRHLSEPTD